MKSKKEIKEWFDTHSVSSFYYGHLIEFLLNKGYSKKNALEIVNMNTFLKSESSFTEFVNWFESKDVKKDCDNCELFKGFKLIKIISGNTTWSGDDSDILKSIPPTPKFKIGDWVRHKDGGVYKITGSTVGMSVEVCYNCSAIDIITGMFGFICSVKELELELWIPKDDEFYVYDKEPNISKAICCNTFHYADFLSNHKYTGKYHSNNPRPAMPEERDALILAVEKEYSKTWNGKEWIDMLKVGDIVIVWDDDKCNAIIGLLKNNKHGVACPYYIGDDYAFENCIKFHSTEQYRDFIK